MEAKNVRLSGDVGGEHPILFFDGVCNLCNSSVDFVVRNDKRKHFRFAALQSNTAAKLLGDHSINLDDPSSFILYQNGMIQHKSSAALAVLNKLGFPFSLARIFKVLPLFIRDRVYDLVARNRYRWFGKKETCRFPTEEERGLFLD
ncbi:MAG: DUF393 domain-containing protein [Bacteroidia bacterium]|nr:DUF393 domain-containing protein [Bacteroidia bacterium]